MKLLVVLSLLGLCFFGQGCATLGGSPKISKKKAGPKKHLVHKSKKKKLKRKPRLSSKPRLKKRKKLEDYSLGDPDQDLLREGNRSRYSYSFDQP